MQQIPNTQKKLREAEFFLTRMKDIERGTRLDKEDFDFYLNAFLAALRSVTFVWQHEDNASYTARFDAWEQELTQPQKDLLEFMNDQRVIVIHQDGSPTLERTIEHVSIFSTADTASARNTPPVGWFTTMGFDEYATIGVRRHYFRLQEHNVSVTEICTEALALLKKLVATV